MGYIKNHSIIVNTFDKTKAELSHHKAMKLLPALTTELKETPVNGDWSFAVLPDGSKEGWTESDEYDALRDMFKKWLKSQAYDDGSNALKWIEVWFDEEGESGITS